VLALGLIAGWLLLRGRGVADNVQTTYEEFMAKGVEFTQPKE
jgi:hypothetical protein